MASRTVHRVNQGKLSAYLFRLMIEVFYALDASRLDA